MKRLLRITVAIVVIVAILLVAFIALLPYVLNSGAVRQEIEGLVHSKTGAQVKLGRIKLVYLPSPCLEFDQIVARKNDITFKAVEVRLYPDIMALLGSRNGGPPIRSISFSKGDVSREITLEHGTITAKANEIHFSTQCNIKGTCDFSTVGSLNLEKRHVSLAISGGNTDIGALIHALLKEDRFKGTFANSFNLAITATLDGNGPYKIKLNSLDLKHPSLKAQGVVEIEKEASQWGLDLDVTARDLDVTDVRPYLTQVLPNEKAIKETVKIVRGGRLDSFHLKFKGNKDDLKHFKNYEISATGRDVPIYIPKLDLLIERVNGSIEIKKEVLRGKGLEARLRSTRGENCSIKLDLGGKHKKMAFRGDLFANGNDILWAVKKFVKEGAVLRRAGEITSTEGRAQGTLEIKGPIKHLAVRIKARPQGLKVRLKSSEDAICANHGGFTLDTGSKQIELNAVAGGFGATQWKALSGKMFWGKGATFDFTFRGVDLDLAMVKKAIESLNKDQDLEKKIKALSGTLNLKKAHFKGNIHRLNAISYEITLGGGKGTIVSPLLPMAASFKGPHGIIVNDSTHIRSLHLMFSDNTTLDLKSMEVSFHNGHISPLEASLTGHVGHTIGGWAIEKAKVPEEFIPKLPLDVEALKISFKSHGNIRIAGTFSHRDKQGKKLTISLNMKKERNLLILSPLTIKGPRSDAKIGFTLKEPTTINGTGGLHFSYKGILTGDELNDLLRQNRLLMDELKGDLSLKIGAMGRPYIKGALEAKGLLWNWGVKRPIFIDQLATVGHNSHLEISHCVFQEGNNHIEGTGTLFSSTNGLEIHFNATGGRIDVDSVLSLLGHGPKERLENKTGVKTVGLIPQRPHGKGIKWPRLIKSMRLKFAIEEAYYNKKVIKEPTGVLTLGEDHGLNLSLYSSTLCGLHTALSLDYSGHAPKAIVRIWTADEFTPPDFSTTLPCLGVHKDLINGPIILDVNLQGTPGNWEKGHFKLKGGPGIIKRSYVIAKIFSIINVTGLFNRNLFKADLPYSLLEITGTVKGEKVLIERLVLKAEGLNFFGRGDILLQKGTIDLFVLVSPFKTFDYILSKIPILGYAIGGKNKTILTIPFKVSGPLEDPSVAILHPEAIGKGMLDLLKNIVSIPIRVVIPEKEGDIQQ